MSESCLHCLYVSDIVCSVGTINIYVDSKCMEWTTLNCCILPYCMNLLFILLRRYAKVETDMSAQTDKV
jgi:hypothetical protein